MIYPNFVHFRVVRWSHIWFFWWCLKGCFVFFLIWHAARTYGRRRGNTIVSNFFNVSLVFGEELRVFSSLCLWVGVGEGIGASEIILRLPRCNAPLHSGLIYRTLKFVIEFKEYPCWRLASLSQQFPPSESICFRKTKWRFFLKREENRIWLIHKYMIILEVQFYLNSKSTLLCGPREPYPVEQCVEVYSWPGPHSCKAHALLWEPHSGPFMSTFCCFFFYLNKVCILSKIGFKMRVFK